MTTRAREAPPTDEPMFTLDGALDLAGIIANRALLDVMPKLIEMLDAHYQANLRENIRQALEDLDRSNGTS